MKNKRDSHKNRLKARKASWSNSDYFKSSLDMAIIKHDEAVKNSKVKRGELKLKGNNEYVSNCKCGARGCTMPSSYANSTESYYRHSKQGLKWKRFYIVDEEGLYFSYGNWTNDFRQAQEFFKPESLADQLKFYEDKEYNPFKEKNVILLERWINHKTKF